MCHPRSFEAFSIHFLSDISASSENLLSNLIFPRCKIAAITESILFCAFIQKSFIYLISWRYPDDLHRIFEYLELSFIIPTSKATSHRENTCHLSLFFHFDSIWRNFLLLLRKTKKFHS